MSVRPRILLVEEASVFREMQGLLLSQAGYAVAALETPQAALVAVEEEHYDLAIVDHGLPGMNGQEFMRALRKLRPDIATIFISGALTLDLAIQLSRQGAAGILPKPANPKAILEKIAETLARSERLAPLTETSGGKPPAPARRGISYPPLLPGPSIVAEVVPDRPAYSARFVLGNSDTFREFTHRLWQVRDFRTVLLLQGERGSPFELLAREIAELSIFRDGPFMSCDAARFVSHNLIETLAPSLLSHDAGTLFVPGAETLTASQQDTLDDLLAGRGVFAAFTHRFRLVLASSGPLAARVDAGAFDPTLFARVGACTLDVPSLREMRDDVVTNARRILAAHHAAGRPRSPLAIAPDAAEWLRAQDWPGNYEQLEQAMLAAAGETVGSEIALVTLLAGHQREVLI